jgi:hypothetical protein
LPCFKTQHEEMQQAGAAIFIFQLTTSSPWPSRGPPGILILSWMVWQYGLKSQRCDVNSRAKAWPSTTDSFKDSPA